MGINAGPGPGNILVADVANVVYNLDPLLAVLPEVVLLTRLVRLLGGRKVWIENDVLRFPLEKAVYLPNINLFILNY